MFILADTREKPLLKHLALISFRNDIIDFNEMFMEWSVGVAKSFASLPDGYLWGLHRGRRREAVKSPLPETLSLAHLYSPWHTTERNRLLVLIKSI